jgi:hypothetical protein
MISASMPSGVRYFGIRKAALVVVVKADPILTLRMVWPSEVRGTIAATASVVASNLRRLIMGLVLPGGCGKNQATSVPKSLRCGREVLGSRHALLGRPVLGSYSIEILFEIISVWNHRSREKHA